ncbi:MAG: zinc ribbon domain-containing protein [Dehalococcoidales bacterium]|nr:zinc ribbon domain-containing protein [Dehalococcoidales bacterium]
MKNIEKELESRFVCAKCRSTGAEVKSLAMSGTGLSKLLDIQHNRYVFASCNNCGFTEVYNLDILAGKRDDALNILDIIFG